MKRTLKRIMERIMERILVGLALAALPAGAFAASADVQVLNTSTAMLSTAPRTVRAVFIQNNGPATIYCKLGATPTTSTGIQVPAGGSLRITSEVLQFAQVNCIAASSQSSALTSVTELP